MKNNYETTSEVILWSGDKAAWHFAVIDEKISAEIKEKHAPKTRGFGSIKVRATVGDTVWQTSIFPDKKSETYMLPIKAKVRDAEGIRAGDSIKLGLEIM